MASVADLETPDAERAEMIRSYKEWHLMQLIIDWIMHLIRGKK
jgi:hypothetical protein